MTDAHPDAGKRLDPSQLVDVEGLIRAYHDLAPDPGNAGQRVTFGTSGHRGSALECRFNEAHILAIAQAVCLHRARTGIDGPLFLGVDTHALSGPAARTAIEVFAANEVAVVTDARDGFTPTPVISHAILSYNRGRTSGLADGVVITPSHNPPEDGGFKYNPPHGGPSEPEVAGSIERLANALLDARLGGVRRMSYDRAYRSSALSRQDFRSAYVDDLANVLDFEAISASSLRIGIDPLGGSSVDYWPAIIERYRLDACLVSDTVDPSFGFMPADRDGRIRMDCSSPYAMAQLLDLKDRFDISVGNDPDADRHGIVTASQGLMPPNDYLAACVAYLFMNRPQWPRDAGIGKTMVTSALIDRLAAHLDRRLVETPVGFRWFVDAMLEGKLGFAGEESAGATLLRKNSSVWTTDKDGIALGLLAAEIMAKTGRDPTALYAEVTATIGKPFYRRTDAPATRREKEQLRQLTPHSFEAGQLAGEAVIAIESAAPSSGAPLGGVRVRSANGWFAARPSGTEDIYKIYAESFRSLDHLDQIESEAKAMIGAALAEAAVRH
ncbi:phosphoglucomutase, alpha-D-glucose phosphate-specific [Novosphingobium indicum]|uniref:Phosphoglucomutase n=1 Tax=Novosphingobium indicum TaxID=462949 RepID=A0ABQ2JHV5_9SPHN|nr:phosphoglucomutase (alpha-D-glucose-1,6-bisphosphate-dependent) [Novosphingobium indicum]GGN46060.1 phosphoglucomutase, alpha-D-glucose phosphate-specific [Novosphingobium indicum]